MGKGTLFWSGQRVMKRWRIDKYELFELLRSGLVGYLREDGLIKVTDENVGDYNPDVRANELLFYPTDIVEFESTDGFAFCKPEPTGLGPKDARELGLLRKQREKMESSIEVAVHVGIFCSTTGHPIIRREIEDVVFGLDQKIPDVNIDKMWRVIPEKFKKGAGRPKKE